MDFITEHPFRGEIAEVAIGALPQIGHPHQIRQQVVAVELQQRIAVEQNGVDAANRDDAKRQIVEFARLGRPPNPKRSRGEDEFDIDASRPDGETTGEPWERPGVADIVALNV